MDGGSWDAPWITYVDFHFEDKYVEVGMGLITSLTRPLLSMLMLLGRCMRGTEEGGRKKLFELVHCFDNFRLSSFSNDTEL